MTLRRPITGVRFPDHLPIVLAFFATVLVSAWLLAPVIAESVLGRPGSTAGLGFVFGPVFGLGAGAAAFLIAIGLRRLARSAGIVSVLVPRWLVACGVLATTALVIVLAVSARTQAIAKEVARRPHVIVESTRFVKSNQSSSGGNARAEAPLLFSIYRDAVVPSIDWNGHAISITGSDEHVTVLDKAGARLASTDLHAFDYIGSIRATPVCRNSKGDHDLAVLVTLRATSDRSMLIVYGSDGGVVYQEHLERTGRGNRWAGSMYVASRDEHDLLVVEHGPTSVWTCQRKI